VTTAARRNRLEKAITDYRDAREALETARTRLMPLLRAAIEGGSVNQSEAARLLGVSRQAVQKIMRQQRR
jgi:predicted XRE-type DNA-binding protein